MLLSACSKDSAILGSGTFDMSLRAELPEMEVVDTKASSHYTVRINWSEGDCISVLNLTTGKILGGALTADKSGTATTFSGSVSGTVREGDVITYFYPAQGNASEVDFTSIHIDMSSQPGTTSGVPLCLYSTSTASADSFDEAFVTFSFMMSYVMIALSDIPASAQIKSVTLSGVTSAFDLTRNSDKSGLDITATEGQITLSPETTASAAGVRTVYAAVPATSSHERTVTLETAYTSFTTDFTSASILNGYAYNTNVAGFLVDDLIPVDEAVRDYCLENFDTNGDGKLSMVEIAGVTELPLPLPENISSFNELEYFYSLTTLPSFKNQRSLSSITIPKQITSIADETFSGCTSLVKVYLKPTVPPTLGSDVFNGIVSNVQLIVPDEVVSDYQNAEGWRDLFNNFRTESSQNNSDIVINTEDENSMGQDRVDIIVK